MKIRTDIKWVLSKISFADIFLWGPKNKRLIIDPDTRLPLLKFGGWDEGDGGMYAGGLLPGIN